MYLALPCLGDGTLASSKLSGVIGEPLVIGYQSKFIEAV